MRLPGYDYTSTGAYFVTVCTAGRRCIFGEIDDGEMCLGQLGRIVWERWTALPQHYPNVRLDAFVVMPNHIHGIILLERDRPRNVGAGLKPAPTRGLAEIVRGFKTFSSRAINSLRSTPGQAVWQRGYYDRIVRDEVEMVRIQQYILDNPLRWADDSENPNKRGGS